MTLLKRMATVSVIAVCALVSASAQAALIYATASLDASQEVPTNGSLALGEAILVLDTETNLIGLGASFAGISIADITFPEGGLAFGAAGPFHIHSGPPGVNGPLLVPFGNPDYYTQFDGYFEVLTTEAIAVGDDFARELRRGNLYLNLHSLAYPGGEIRGQLTVVPEGMTSVAMLVGLLGLIAIRLRRA